MSTTIDQRVVEMRFDNRQFEQNVSNTMSTLEKLKQKLNFSGASKSFEGLNSAAKSVNMAGLGASVEQVSAKFSALQVMCVTALANITNSAVNAGKRIVSALTIDPVKTGFQEYETQINAVQTILANTESKGTTIEDVNVALEELNKYADQTIYNFTEMTRNIGTFTAAGVDLDTSVSAIKGIANLAAVSGSTSQQASTAMYQLSQALATGTVKLQDWNSVVNAGMGGEVFQNALIRTAATMDGAAEYVEEWRAANIDAFGSFRDSLTNGGWLTTEVLTETLNQFTLATGDSKELWEEYKASLMETGYTEKQAEEILKMANTATDAATKVKTFTQLWDVLKESAQSGWSQTWKLIIGDFEEAKNLLSPLASFLTGFIDRMSDFRNDIIDSALGRGFSKIGENINSLLKPASKAAKTIKDTVDVINDLSGIVDDVILGKFGNGEDRYIALTEAGVNYYEVQNKVNEKLGDGHRHSQDLIDAQNELLGTTTKSADKTKEQLDATADLSDKEKDRLKTLLKMTEAELKAKDYSDEQIEALKELGKQSKKLGLSTDDFIDNLDEINGRWLLMNSFKNIGKGLVDTFAVIGGAWRDIFPEATVENFADALFNAISAFHRFTSGIANAIFDGEELTKTGEKLYRTFRGVFAAFDLVTTVIGGVFKVVFKVAVAVMDRLGMSFLDVTAIIGDVLVGIHSFVEGILNVSGIAKFLANIILTVAGAIKKLVLYIKDSKWFGEFCEYLDNAAKGMRELFKSIPDLTEFKNLISVLKKCGDAVKDWAKTLKSSDNIPRDIIAGLVKGIIGGVPEVLKAIFELAKSIISGICDVLGIHSPSRVMIAIGGFIIAGLILGLTGGEGGLFDAVEDMAGGIFDKLKKALGNVIGWLRDLDLGAIFAAALSVGSVIALIKIGQALSSFAAAFEGFGELLESAGVAVQSFSKVLNAQAFKIRMEGIKTLVTSLLMLVGAIVVLTLVDPKKLLASVGIITLIALVLVGLTWAMNEISTATASIDWKNGLNIKGLMSGLMSIGIAILLIAMSVKTLGSLDPEQAKQGLLSLAAIIGIFAALFAVIGLVVEGKTAQNIDKFGAMMTKMGIALLLIAAVVKIAGKLEPTEFARAGVLMLTFLGFVFALSLIALIPTKGIDKLGKTMLSISLALLMMVAVVKLASKLTFDEIDKGCDFLIGFTVFVAILAAIGGLGGKGIDGVGKMMLGISISMLLMIAVMKLVATMRPGDMAKGFVAIIAFTAIITYLVKTLGKVGPELPKVALTLIAFSVAIGILAIVTAALGLINLADLAKGTLIVGALSLMMRGLITATRGATNITGTVIAMTVAIGVMVAAVALLTLIDPAKLAIATVAISVLMHMFSVMTKATSMVGQAMGTVIAMAAAIAAIGGVLYLLSGLPVESVIASAASLAGLMIVLTGVLHALVPIGNAALQALIGVGLLVAMVAPLMMFVGILTRMQDVKNATDNAVALSILVTTLSLVLVPLAVVGGVAPAARTGIGLLLAFVGSIAVLVTAIGALMTKFPHLEDFVDKGIDILKKLASGLGAVIGSFVTGFTGEIMNVLPQLGTALSKFMLSAMPFIVGVKMVDDDTLKRVGILSAAILALSVADFVSAILTLGGSGLVVMGLSLSAFMVAASGFFVGLKDVDPTSLYAVEALADAILTLTAANVIDGLASLFGGGNSLDTFAAQLPKLGTGLRGFLDNVGTLAGDETATINCAANAVKTLASAASEIPNAGGLLASLVGENELGTFAEQFPTLGSGLRGFLDNVGTFTDEQLAIITSAAEAVKTLASAANEIPNMGGLLATIVGENGLGAFAEQFPVLGTGLRGFLDNIGTFTDEQVTIVTSAAEAVKTLATTANEIPNAGGLLADLVGDNSLETFAGQFPALGTGLRGFLDNVGTFGDGQVDSVSAAATAVQALAAASKNIDGQAEWAKKIFGDDSIGGFSENFGKLGTNLKTFVTNLGTFTDAQVSTIRSAVNAIKALTGLANADLSGAKKAISGFGDKLAGFGTDLNDFCTEMPSSTSVDSAVTGLRNILSAIDEVSAANSGSLGELADNLKKVGDKAVEKFISAFTSYTAKADVKEAADALAEKAVDGAGSKATGKGSMYSAGQDLGSGLVSGINSKKDAVYWAGYALGQKAVQGEKDGQKSNSPSKLTIQSGKWFGEGLVIGIQKMGDKVYTAGHDLGDTAVKSLSSTVSRIATAIDSDVDVQPTIRPVLDLSDVRSGAGAIGDMLSAGSSVGVLANVGSISRAMNSRIQNVSNADVVAAIDKLDRHLDNVGNTSYTISGITYDDGSNIATAIKDLTRYARMERRV